jgi:uncharacterized membrane protein YkvI
VGATTSVQATFAAQCINFPGGGLFQGYFCKLMALTLLGRFTYSIEVDQAPMHVVVNWNKGISDQLCCVVLWGSIDCGTDRC